jgi:hypothetical protein
MIDFDNMNGIHEQIRSIMSQHMSPTDVQPILPQMVQDAITAIESDGHKPPAAEMQQAAHYFADLASKAID